MPQTYFAILTAVGEAKDANAKALGVPFNITEMAVGDGNGALPVPDRTRTTLVNQVRRAPLNLLKRDPVNTNQLIAEQVIPENIGGWWIREMGLYDADGDLIAIANCPPSYKPQLAEGSGRTQTVRMILIMASADAVTLKVDPSVVLATRKYADDAITASMAAHLAAADPHPQYLTEAEGNAKIAAAVAALVNASPAALDTLAELANSLNNDANFAATITNALALKAPLASPALTGTPTAPTQVQFDTSTKLATMAAVHRELGSFSGYRQIAANTALTEADAGKLIWVYGAAVATLPPLASVPIKTVIHFGGNGGITPSAGEALNVMNGASKTNYPIASAINGSGSSFLSVVKISETIWQVYAGAGALKDDGLFAASLAPNGSQKLPSGKIEQWGATGLKSGGTTSTISFPIAFPNTCLAVFLTPTTAGGAGQQNSKATSPSKTGFAYINYSAAPEECFFYAIGN